MSLSNVDVLFHVGGTPETSWQIHHDLKDSLGKVNHDDVKARLETLANDSHIQTAVRTFSDSNKPISVYWR